MQIEIIAIGDEILAGHTLNSNAGFISKQLYNRGYAIDRHVVIGDKNEDIQNTLKKALSRSDLVIVTGGLGPTVDDKTKNNICELLSVPLEMNEELSLDLKKRFGNISSLKEQSSIPRGSSFFINTVGTAPGIAITSDSSTLILLPGVPQEMKHMFLEKVIPFIEKKFFLKDKIFEEKIFLCLLEELDVDPFIKDVYKKYPNIEIGIYPSYAHLQIRLRTRAKSKEKAAEEIKPLKEKIVKKFQEYVFSFKKSTIAETLHDILFDSNIKIAFAESCSGGALAKEITSIPGSSNYFLGSIVCYSNDIKRDILHVSEKTLDTKGAVSTDTVKEMLLGVFSITDANYAIAISGIAGPSGGTFEKPVGTVCIGVGKKGDMFDIGTIQAHGNRETIVNYSVQFALCLLWKQIVQNKLYFEK